jgi:hypothetical protein
MLVGGTIINEFDIDAQPAEDAGAAASKDGAEAVAPAAGPESSRVQETERLLRWHGERSLRIWAH